MTCIVGLVTPGGSYLGGDSAASTSDFIAVSSTPKVFRFGSTLVGYSGNFGNGQHAIRFLKNTPMVRKLDAFINDYEPQGPGWSLLMVEYGRIYEIDEDMGVIEAPIINGYSYAAIGSGSAVASGALFVERLDIASVHGALTAASTHCLDVRAPFEILEA